MDPLSIIAGTTGTAAFALHAAHRLYEFVNNIVDAPTEVAIIARDAEALSKILASLQQWLDMGVIKIDAARSLSDSLNICVTSMSQLQAALLPYTKLVGHSTLRWRSFGWAFKRSQVIELRERLQHGKSTLNISLSIINTYATASGNLHLSQQIESGNQALRDDFRTLQDKVVNRRDFKIGNASMNAADEGSMFNGTDSGLLLRRYIEDLPPVDHPWSGASDIGEILSIETMSLYEVESRPPTPTISPTKSDFSHSKLPLVMSPLHRAVAEDNIRKVMELLDAGADVNDPGEGRRTPLHVCARHNNKVMAEVLLMKGANLKIEDADGKTPLRVALEKTHEEAACLFLVRGRQIEVLADYISGVMRDEIKEDDMRICKACMNLLAQNEALRQYQDNFVKILQSGPHAQQISVARLYEMLGEKPTGDDDVDGEEDLKLQHDSKNVLVNFDEEDMLDETLVENELTQHYWGGLSFQPQYNLPVAVDSSTLRDSDAFKIEPDLLTFEEEGLEKAKDLALKETHSEDAQQPIHEPYTMKTLGMGLEQLKSQPLVLEESHKNDANVIVDEKPPRRAFSWE